MRFVNEFGNTIGLSVTAEEIEGVPGIKISITGPNSQTENHITLAEAETLYEELARALGKTGPS